MNYSVSESVALDRSRALVIALVGKNASEDWWQSPNRAFDMQKPIDQWQHDWHAVYDYLMHHGVEK
jgi:hypothetical protein